MKMGKGRAKRRKEKWSGVQGEPGTKKRRNVMIKE